MVIIADYDIIVLFLKTSHKILATVFKDKNFHI